MIIDDLDFITIRYELDSLPANSKERSKKALDYLKFYNLPEKVAIADIIKYYATGTDKETWKWLYLIERSIPYYQETQPEWQKRLLYFASTYIFEFLTLLGRKFNYNGTEVKLLFSKHSGDHQFLHAGPNPDDAPDFYIYFNETKEYLFIDYKFASTHRFNSIEQVYNHYLDGKHMHGAKLLLSFLEAEEKYYLVDYINNEYYELDLPLPASYISTEDTDAFADPLVDATTDNEFDLF